MENNAEEQTAAEAEKEEEIKSPPVRLRENLYSHITVSVNTMNIIIVVLVVLLVVLLGIGILT